MSKFFSFANHPTFILSILSILLFNGFAFKVIIDPTPFSMIPTLFFYHFLGISMISVFQSPYPFVRRSFLSMAIYPLLFLPTLIFLVVYQSLSILTVISYFIFLFCTQIIISLLIQQLKAQRTHVFFSVCFLWGSPLLIERTGPFYDLIAPFTLS